MIASINRLYRMIFCRGGHGVHSPFVFDLLTTVIEEKMSYYCYESLSSVRMQFQQCNSNIEYDNRRYTVENYLNKYCFSECENRLLFRLANRFKPRTIYVIGSDLGLAPLYLTAYSKSAHCVVVEPEPTIAAIAQKFVDKYSSSKIDIHASGNTNISDNGVIDLFVWGKSNPNASGSYYISEADKNSGISETSVAGTIACKAFSLVAFEKLLPYINDESVMVISDINSSKKNVDTWKKICAHSRVTVTLDLYSLGVVFFNPKLHRKTYKSLV